MEFLRLNIVDASVVTAEQFAYQFNEQCVAEIGLKGLDELGEITYWTVRILNIEGNSVISAYRGMPEDIDRTERPECVTNLPLLWFYSNDLQDPEVELVRIGEGTDEPLVTMQCRNALTQEHMAVLKLYSWGKSVFVYFDEEYLGDTCAV